jgi:hypothetical protein
MTERPLPSIFDETRRLTYSEEWGEEIQQRVEDYMGYLRDSIDIDSDDPAYYDPETLTGIPYCGCYVCEERELMTAVMMETLKANADGLVELKHDAG